MFRRGAACVCSCVLVLVAACGLEAVGTGASIDGVPGSTGASPVGTSPPDTSDIDTGDGAATPGADADSGDEASTTCSADTSKSLEHCGGCFAACPAGSTSCTGGQCLSTLRIRVGIDGESHFVWTGAQAHWHQVTYAAPARHGDTPLPLELNGQVFNPTWPDVGGDTQNYSCDCDSSAMTVPSPPLPARAQTVGLEVIASRVAISILEQPSAGNGHRLIVRFTDVGEGGSAYYEALLTYRTR